MGADPHARAPLRSRLAAVLAAMMLLAGCDWAVPGFNGWNSGNNDTETALSLANVGGLHVAWSAPGPSGAADGTHDAWSTGPLQQIAVVGRHVFTFDGLSVDIVDRDTGTDAGGYPALTTHGTDCPGGAPSVDTHWASGLTIADGLLYALNWERVCGGALTDFGDSAVKVGPGNEPPLDERTMTWFATVASDGTVVRTVSGPYPDMSVVGGSLNYNEPLAQELGPLAVWGNHVFTVGHAMPILGPPSGGGYALLSIDRSTGTPTWGRAVTSTNLYRPSTDGSRVYLTQGADVLAFDLATGATDWQVTLPAFLNIEGPTIGENGLIYVESADHVYALDAATGATAWSATTPTADNRPTVSNGVLYVASGSQLSMFDAAGSVNCSAGVCSPVATVPLGATSSAPPVVSHGAVYVGAGSTLVKLVP